MTTDPRSDESLVESARAGDAAAFDELVTRYQDRVYGLAMRLSGHPQDAEDILQQTFLKAYQALGDFRGEAKFSTWLYRIATTAALMQRRAKRRTPPTGSLDRFLPRFDGGGHLDVEFGQAARADEILEREELARELREALGRLPEGYRAPFVLRELEGLSTEEAAEILGLSPEALRTRVHRARLMLRGYLGHLAGSKS